MARGVPVVLHHGFAADVSSNWTITGIVERLRADGRTVIALDARGHGRSGKPHDPSSYGHDVMSRDVSKLLDHLDFSLVDLIGYSMGGYVAAITAVRREPRLRSVVIGGIGAPALAKRGLDRSAIADALLADDPRTVADRTARQFRRFAEATGSDRHALAAIMRAPFRPVGDVSQIRIPTLVLVGADDELATNPEILADAIPGARLVVTEGIHLRAPAVPAFAQAIIEFLRDMDEP